MDPSRAPTGVTGVRRGLLRLVVVGAVGLTTVACGTGEATDSAPVVSVRSGPIATLSTAPPTPTAPPSTTPTTTSTTTTPSTTTTSTTTTTTPTTAPTTGAAPTTTGPPADPAPEGRQLPATEAAFARLAADNPAVSLSVVRDGVVVLQRASGSTVGGDALTADSPMVVASVSKVITALGIARLVESGRLDLAAPVPWTELGLTPDPGWNDVTVRQLLDHTSGMPIARKTWLDLPGPCAVPLQDAVAAPPRPERGTWVYSNGNYCALGMLIEYVTGESLDAATQHLVFEPAGVDGPHLTSAGTRPGDGPYAGAISRFDRLGGAGTWMASTDDLVAILGSVTPADRVTLAWPAMITDQYGWGHTGTVTGATACAWALDDGRTFAAAVVAGNSPATGGGVCDAVVPAVSADFGDWRGEPIRTPD